MQLAENKKSLLIEQSLNYIYLRERFQISSIVLVIYHKLLISTHVFIPEDDGDCTTNIELGLG